MAQQDTKDSSQSLDNRSFNPTYGMYEHIAYGFDGTNVTALKTDAEGRLVSGNTLASYNAYASEDTGTYYYIAKENDGGAWYIARKTLATGVWDFCKGTSDVVTAWTGRATQTYAKYSDTF